jgi:hypothetical protein
MNTGFVGSLPIKHFHLAVIVRCRNIADNQEYVHQSEEFSGSVAVGCEKDNFFTNVTWLQLLK